MIEARGKRRRVQELATAMLAIALAPALLTPLVPETANAQAADEEAVDEEAVQKAEWQDRYRTLRNNAVRMRDNATKLRRAYSLSQHSNYPRGGARVRFKQQVVETEQKADEFEAQLASFMDEARANQIPPGWIYEVEDEPVDPGLPAAVDGDEATHRIGAPEGRNPMYYGGDDEEAVDEDLEDDRGEGFDDFNDDRDDQYRAKDAD